LIGLDPATVAVLRAHRARQAQERLAAGPAWVDGDLVFSREDGQPFHPQRASRTFDRLVASSGLPRLGMHGLRHSYASAALLGGVPTKALSERLGHSSTSVTSDVYQHVTPEMDADVAARVAGIILGG
jgi:integrase